MSRVGKNPINVPEGVNIEIMMSHCQIKGKLGELEVPCLEHAETVFADNKIIVSARSKEKKSLQAWGTQRTLIANAVQGVSEGFTRKLEVNGVGYRAQMQGKNLRLQLGFSHDVDVEVPDDIKVSIEGDKSNVIVINGISKQRVGQFASNIRRFRPPEPYKGKGVKYLEETIIRKEGKKK